MEHIIDKIKFELYDNLSALCRENGKVIGLFNPTSEDEKEIPEALQRLLNSKFFNIEPCDYAYDCHIRQLSRNKATNSSTYI
jgi:hypothetical protein